MNIDAFKYHGDVRRVRAVEFGVLSADEIRESSVVAIDRPETWSGNEPVPHGLMDPRMGCLDTSRECPTDKLTPKFSPGYFGTIDLARPVFYTQHMSTITKILKSVCFRCSSLLCSDNAKQKSRQMHRKLRFMDMTRNECKLSACPKCKLEQPVYVRVDFLSKYEAVFHENSKTDLSPRVEVTPEIALRIFRQISDEDCELLGFSENCKPESLVCQVLPVCPPAVRPSVLQDNSQRSEDDLTHKYADIIKANLQIKNKLESPQVNSVNAAKTLDGWHNLLQYNVSTLIDNDISGVSQSSHRSGRPLRAIRQRLKSKEGRIRGNLMGKRVNFSARTVITPDPTLDIDELGVPVEIAMHLTFPEKVNMSNIGEIRDLVKRGSNVHPGVRFIYKKDSGVHLSLRYRNVSDEASDLKPGDIVYRHMRDGDVVLFNRQPSLHKMSMMGHRVRVLPGKSFRLNISVTTPYGADFDGDEMNLHFPQSIIARNELENLTAVHRQIISPGNSKPIISFVQDNVVGSYLLTQDKKAFTHLEFMNLMAKSEKYKYRPSRPVKDLLNETYSGSDVLSLTIPGNVPLKLKSKLYDDAPDEQKHNYVVRCENGQVSGIIDSGVYGKSTKGMISIINSDLGSVKARDFFNCVQDVVTDYFKIKGFSVGVKDLCIDDENGQFEEGVARKIALKKNEVSSKIDSVHANMITHYTDTTAQEQFENEVNTILTTTRSEVERLFSQQFKNENWDRRLSNRFFNMIDSGSKGKPVNLVQLTACLGQQSVDGKRVPYSYTDRSLPHFTKYSDDADARGFVSSNFVKGLSPIEFFFHAMGGREGLIDTAVKTSSTGYIQRRLMKASEDLVAKFDYSIRDAMGGVVQYIYGDDGMDPAHIETQELPFVSMKDPASKYGFPLDSIMDFVMDSSVTEMKSTNPDWRIRVETRTNNAIDLRNKFVFDAGVTNDIVRYPVNIVRIIENSVQLLSKNSKRLKTDLTPIDVYDGIDLVLSRCVVSKHVNANSMLRALLEFHASPRALIVEKRLTRKIFESMCNNIYTAFQRSLVQPGEAVGPIAAQSIGEPCTQLTLNTFHQSGMSEVTKITRGVPRIQELLSITRTPKTPMMTVYLNAHYAADSDRVNKIRADLELSRLRDIVTETAIIYDPLSDQSSTIVNDDIPFMKAYRLFESSVDTESNNRSNWVLRICVSRTSLELRKLSMEDVYFGLNAAYGKSISTMYTDDNANNLVFRVYVGNRRDGKNSSKFSDDLSYLKHIEASMLDQIVLRGVPGVTRAITRKAQPQECRHIMNSDFTISRSSEWLIETAGTNLLELLSHDNVDGTRTVSNDIHEINNILGIEAAKRVLFNEINAIIVDQAIFVNDRHIELLADLMTQRGDLVSIDRHGINRGNIGPLAKCSFEQQDSELFRAALASDIDTMTGVSANLMLGQCVPVGTGVTELIIDEEKMQDLLKQPHVISWAKLSDDVDDARVFEDDFSDVDAAEYDSRAETDAIARCDALDFGADDF